MILEDVFLLSHRQFIDNHCNALLQPRRQGVIFVVPLCLSIHNRRHFHRAAVLPQHRSYGAPPAWRRRCWVAHSQRRTDRANTFHHPRRSILIRDGRQALVCLGVVVRRCDRRLTSQLRTERCCFLYRARDRHDIRFDLPLDDTQRCERPCRSDIARTCARSFKYSLLSAPPCSELAVRNDLVSITRRFHPAPSPAVLVTGCDVFVGESPWRLHRRIRADRFVHDRGRITVSAESRDTNSDVVNTENIGISHRAFSSGESDQPVRLQTALACVPIPDRPLADEPHR